MSAALPLQQQLFAPLPRLVRPPRFRHRMTPAQTFEEFHRANPELYAMIVALARQAKAAGHKRYSLKTIFEVLRWHYDLSPAQPSTSTPASKPLRLFKLNNNYTAWYARRIDMLEPDLKGFFELRGQQ